MDANDAERAEEEKSLEAEKMKNHNTRFETARTILTTKEMADYFHCSTEHIRQMAYKKDLPFFKFGSLLRFDKEKVEEWIEKQS